MTTAYCEHNYPTDYTECPVCFADKLRKDIKEVLRLIKSAQDEAKEMPCGVIGKEGPDQRELDAESASGRYYDGDAIYHRAQQIWLNLEQSRKLLEG